MAKQFQILYDHFSRHPNSKSHICRFLSQGQSVPRNLQDKEEIVGTHAVAYKNNTVNFILNSIEGSVYPIDWFLSRNVYSNFNVYIPIDKIFYASSYRDYETDKNEFYKKYKSEIG